MLRPGNQIARRRHREARHIAIPLRVGEHVGAIIRLNESGIFDAAGPLILPLRIGVGIQHGGVATRESETIGALGQPKSRGVPADLALATRVFGAVEQKDFSILRDCSRIEGGVFFPRHEGGGHR